MHRLEAWVMPERQVWRLRAIPVSWPEAIASGGRIAFVPALAPTRSGREEARNSSGARTRVQPGLGEAA